MDSGIRISHKFFNDLAEGFTGGVANFVGPHKPYVNVDTGDDDKLNHGTGTASVALTHAEGANIVNVKIWGYGVTEVNILGGKGQLKSQ